MKKPKGLDDLLDYDEYKAYLYSEIWNKKRNERLIFDDFKCCLCGNRNNVQVHHLVYPLHKNYGTETINDLITVCPDCHRLIDGLRKGQHIELSKAYRRTVNIECWINFNSKEEFDEKSDDLKNNFDFESGDIQVKIFLKEEQLVNHFFGFINIQTYVELKEAYGSDNVKILINN